MSFIWSFKNKEFCDLKFHLKQRQDYKKKTNFGFVLPEGLSQSQKKKKITMKAASSPRVIIAHNSTKNGRGYISDINSNEDKTINYK